MDDSNDLNDANDSNGMNNSNDTNSTNDPNGSNSTNDSNDVNDANDSNDVNDSNKYSCTAIFSLVTFEVIFSFKEHIIQINNYLQAVLFLFNNIEVENYLSDFILLILATTIMIQINNYHWEALFFPLILLK